MQAMYDDMKEDVIKADLKDIFYKGRHFYTTFLISKQRVKLLPGYDYCPDCSLTWIHLESGIVYKCNVCHGLGQIKKKSDKEIPSATVSKMVNGKDSDKGHPSSNPNCRTSQH